LIVMNVKVVAPAAASMASMPPNKTILDIGYPQTGLSAQLAYRRRISRTVCLTSQCVTLGKNT
jgi:hypothetical protein